jgi:hypothetical protein
MDCEFKCPPVTEIFVAFGGSVLAVAYSGRGSIKRNHGIYPTVAVVVIVVPVIQRQLQSGTGIITKKHYSLRKHPGFAP